MLWLLLVELCTAHNWVSSPSRVPFAATVFPCLPPRNDFPHVQVGRGQNFQIEWSVGHDRDVYFTLYHKNDSMHIRDMTKKELDDYITSAPANAHLESRHYHKYRLTSKLGTDKHYQGLAVSTYYKGLVSPSDPVYIQRPSEFGNPMNLYEYKDTDTANDVYIAYSNSKYPWVKAIWRFAIIASDPGEDDVALFDIPTQYTANGGDFIVHYMWSGYYDCIDINVLPQSQPTAYPYGRPPNGTSAIAINRIDHCIFDDPNAISGFPRVTRGLAKNGADICTRACVDTHTKGQGCAGVVTFPLDIWNKNYGPHWNMNSNILQQFYEAAWTMRYPYDMDIGLPYDNKGSGIWKIYTGNNFVVNMTTLNIVRQYTESLPDPWVCIPVTPRFPTSTSDKYTVTDDPLDPVWYSTCYEVVDQLEFIGYSLGPALDSTVPYLQMQGTCISCADAVAWEDSSYVPNWKLAPVCRNCERDDPNPTVVRPEPVGLMMTGANPRSNVWNSACAAEAQAAGYSGTNAGSSYCLMDFTSYHHLVENDGGNGIYWQMKTFFRSADQCAAFLRLQPECSRYMFGTCDCVRNTTCCLNSIAISAGTTNFYDIRPSVPDPTCATGQLDSTGKICCLPPKSGSCSQGCSASTVVNTGSFCRSDLISPLRKCSDSSPPCYV